MEKEICKDIFNRSKEIGLQYTDLLGDGDSKDYNEFWQKHRDKQIKCNRVNKIKCINHMDKRCSTALSDLRDAWRGHNLPDGKAICGKKNCLTEVNIKKLKVNYGKAIRSNVACARCYFQTKMQLTR